MTTNTDYRSKARAVFLAAIMIVSMVGMPMALAGSAAAATPTGGSLSDNVVQPGTDVSIEEVSANEDGNPLYILAANETSETINATATISEGDISAEGSWSTTFNPNSDLGLADGDSFQIYIGEGETYSDRDNDVGSLTVDGTGPSVDATSPSSGDTISTDTPEIVIDLSETESSVDTSTLEVTATENAGDNQLFQLNEPNAQGVSYDSGTQNLTINIAETRLPEPRPDGQIDVDVSGADVAGNALTGTTGFSFTIDTNPVSASVKHLENANSQIITADVSSTAADIDTAEITIDGAGDYSETFDTSSDLYDAGTFTVEAGPEQADDIGAIPEGSLSVTVTATDTDGQSDTDTEFQTIDTNPPVVDSLTVNNGQNVTVSNGDAVDVIATFNETVDPSTVTGTVTLEDGNTVALGGTNLQNEDNDDSNETVVYQADLITTSGVENTEAEVSFSSAQDTFGNTNSSLAATQTFAIDTVAPTINVDTTKLPDGNVLRNVVDIAEAFSASEADGNSYEVYVAPGANDADAADGNYVPISAVTDQPLDDLNTTTIPEGTHTLKVNVSDDAGNTFAVEPQIVVDNEDPSATAPQTVSGVVDISETLDVSGTGVEQVTYGYTENPTEVEVGFTQADTIDVNDLGDGTYVLAAQVKTTAPYNVYTASVEGASPDYNVETEENADDAGAIDITVNASEDLTNFNVTAATDDSFRTQSSEVLSSENFDRTEVELDNGDTKYVFTNTYDAPRDGEYDVELTNASLDAQYYEPGTLSEPVVDDETPSITDADIAGVGTDGRTQVSVQFNEPVQDGNDFSSLSAADGTEVNQVIDGVGTDGEVIVEFNDVLQTGDGLSVEYAADAISEEFTVEAGDENDGDDANAESISRTVDTVDLQLSAGQNLVSVPAETGTVALSELNTENIETVYAWDDGSWTGFTPGDDTSDLQNLEGGQGYVFTMSAADEIPVQAYNKPGETGNGPAPLTDEDIEVGWNLIGHYQEANQDRGTALTEVSGSYDAANVLGEQTDGDFGAVTQLQPGEGYWLYADQTDNYARSPFSGGPVLSALSVTGADNVDGVVQQGENVDISVDADDLQGVSTVEFEAADGTVTELTGESTYTADGVNVNTTGTATDRVIGTITATDTVGDTSTRTVSVDVVNPTASWDKDNFEVNGQYDLTQDSTVENADTTTYEYSTDSGSTWNTISDETTWDTTGLADGDVDVRITAEDDQGGSDTATTTVTVDTTVETTSLTATNDNAQEITVTVEADEQLSDLTASDGSDNSVSGVADTNDFSESVNNDETYTYEATYDAGADGDYTVTLDSASDTNGNSNSSTGLSDSVTVDTTGSFSGKVTNGSGDAIADTQVTFNDSNGNQLGQTTTDANGEYTVEDVEEGTYDITASADGYKDDTTNDVEITGEEDTADTDFTLSEAGEVHDVDELQINADFIGIVADDNNTVSLTASGFEDADGYTIVDREVDVNIGDNDYAVTIDENGEVDAEIDPEAISADHETGETDVSVVGADAEDAATDSVTLVHEAHNLNEGWNLKSIPQPAELYQEDVNAVNQWNTGDETYDAGIADGVVSNAGDLHRGMYVDAGADGRLGYEFETDAVPQPGDVQLENGWHLASSNFAIDTDDATRDLDDDLVNLPGADQPGITVYDDVQETTLGGGSTVDAYDTYWVFIDDPERTDRGILAPNYDPTERDGILNPA